VYSFLNLFFRHSIFFLILLQGLVIRDHVVDRESEEDGSSRPILSVRSLWKQACVRLLDIDVDMLHGSLPPSASTSSPPSLGSTSSSTVSAVSGSVSGSALESPSPSPSSSSSPLERGQEGTWDQRFFSQIELTDRGKVSIQDMMLNILRVAVRCLLSRDGVDSVDVALEGEWVRFIELYHPSQHVYVDYAVLYHSFNIIYF
jgi:hypothetical protein